MIKEPIFFDMRYCKRTLLANRDGVALIEFAMVLPVLLLLFLGGYQLLDASACKRRVTIATRAVADLISQNDKVTESDINTTISAASQIMTPYSADNAQIRVSEVWINQLGRAKVQWSRGANPYQDNIRIRDWPTGMTKPGTYYILSEITYSYNPVISSMISPTTFSQTLIMLPRKSDSVDITT